jgi:hypothetical protein
MKYFIVIFLCCFFLSCNKSYTYVEKIRKTDISGEELITLTDPELFTANSDSEAYLIAFDKYYLSVITDKKMKNIFGSTNSETIEFYIYNSNNIDITNIISFDKKDSLINSITTLYEALLKVDSNL